MEARKNKELELDKKRGLFFNIGLVISLLLVISAFEMKFEEITPEANVLSNSGWDDPIIIPITVHSPKLPIPPSDKLKTKSSSIISSEPLEIPKVYLPEIFEPSVDSVRPTTFINLPPEEVDSIFMVVERFPEPMGGYTAFYQQLRKKMKYPRRAIGHQINGSVYVEFVVDKDGALTEPKIVKGIGFGCDEEVLNAFADVPKWHPGKQRGVPVKVKMVLPVKFQNE